MQSTISPTDLLSALEWRYATKVFDPARSIPQPDWEAIEKSLVLTPSSFGLQPWKFIVVDDKDLRRKLREESWNQPQVTDASRFVVFTARTDLTKADIDSWIPTLASANGVEPEALGQLRGMIVGFSEALSCEARAEWNARQAYIALGQLMLAAAALGIDTCPMEGLSREAYDRILGLENSGYTTLVACALGYRDISDKYASRPKARYTLDRVVTHM